VTTKTDQLIAVRDLLQTLLDNYQIRDPGMVTFQTAMVNLQTAIDMPDPAPEVITQPITSTADVVAGVLSGLAGLQVTIDATASDVAQLIEASGELKNAIISVEADTSALRVDSAQIIANTTSAPNPA
jgi:hypothetical protein